jgi:hypothetical protein
MKLSFLFVFTVLAAQAAFAGIEVSLISPKALDGRSCIFQVNNTVNTTQFTLVTRPFNVLGSVKMTRTEICHRYYSSDDQEQNIQYAQDAQIRCLEAIKLATEFKKEIDMTNCQLTVVD